MPSKKKAKPSFDVPEELRAAPQAGWVYRSEDKPAAEAAPEAAAPATPAHVAPVSPAPAPQAAAASAKKPESKENKSEDYGILDLAARTVSSGFAAVGNFLLLTAHIAAAPLSMGMRILGRK